MGTIWQPTLAEGPGPKLCAGIVSLGDFALGAQVGEVMAAQKAGQPVPQMTPELEAIGVMTETPASMTFVASQRPPMPTSTTAASTG